MRWWIVLVTMFSIALIACSGDDGLSVSEEQLLLQAKYVDLMQIGEQVIEACPMAELDDVEARDACSANLKGVHDLYNRSDVTVFWGGHSDESGSYSPLDHKKTEFPPVTWVPTYLGQFMMDGSISIDESDEHVALWLGTQWRTNLPLGYLPYAFNHDESGDKWRAHQNATHLIFVFEKSTGKFVAAYRYGNDTTRVSREMPKFDGVWTWSSADGVMEPRVSMFDYVLSDGNPYYADLESAWYEMFNFLHAVDCVSCHNPSDPSKMAGTEKGLEIANIPAQALALAVEKPNGQTLVEEVEAATMPPTGSSEEYGAVKEALPLIARFQDYAEAAMEWEHKQHEEAAEL